MNTNQHRLYWRLWAQASRKLRAAGKADEDLDAIRKRIHFKAGAYTVHAAGLTVKRSSILNNRDFDQVKAAFLSIINGADLVAQLEQIEMPARRILHATAELLDQIGLDRDDDHRAAYLRGIARKPLEDCDDEDLQRIVIACNHTAMHKSGRDHNHPRVGRGPQSRFAHRVGHHKSLPGSCRGPSRPPEPVPQPRITQPTLNFN